MDAMKITILADGTIKTETDRISAANHSTAEGFLRFIAQLSGGKTERKHKHGFIGAVMHAVDHMTNRAH